MKGLSEIHFTDACHAAIASNASDLHVQSGTPLAMRVEGNLQFHGKAAMSDAEVRSIAASLLGDDAIAEILNGRDVSASWSVDACGPARVHAFRVDGGIALSIRFLQRQVPPLESLDLPDAVEHLTRSSRGLIVFTGATGSGKTTTMAAFIDRMNAQAGRRIVTIEDPIEYRHVNRRSLIAQREIGTHATSFGAALIGALRADPDVIAIGEMRDSEAMAAALTAAETGHLVLATLHTGDAAQTVDRIVDGFDASRQGRVRNQLAQVLEAVVSQRLVRRLGGGRRALVEVLIANDAVRAIIRDDRRHQLGNAMSTGRSFGMQTFAQHEAALVAAGQISGAGDGNRTWP